MEKTLVGSEHFVEKTYRMLSSIGGWDMPKFRGENLYGWLLIKPRNSSFSLEVSCYHGIRSQCVKCWLPYTALTKSPTFILITDMPIPSAITVSLVDSSVDATENDGSTQFCVNITHGNVESTANVYYSTNSGTATGIQVVYIPTPSSIVLAPSNELISTRNFTACVAFGKCSINYNLVHGSNS